METDEKRLKATREAAERLHGGDFGYSKGYRFADNASYILFLIGLLIATWSREIEIVQLKYCF